MLSLISLIFLSGGAEWKFIRRHQKVQKLQGEGERWRAGERVSQVQTELESFPMLLECHFIFCCTVNVLHTTEYTYVEIHKADSKTWGGGGLFENCSLAQFNRKFTVLVKFEGGRGVER